MEAFGQLMNICWEILNLNFTVFGFTLSLWNVFAFSVVASIVGSVLWRCFFDD